MNKYITCCLISILAGCSHVSKDDLAQTIEKINLKATASECLVEGEFPSESWWELFDDPQLTALIQKAIEGNYTLKGALARLFAARQETKGMRAPLIPSLTADAEDQWQHFSKYGFVRDFYPSPSGVVIPGTANQIDLSLNFEYELDFFGRNRHRLQAAINEERASRAEFALSRLLVTTMVTQTYLELQAKEIQHRLIAKRIAVQEKISELTDASVASGLDKRQQALKEIAGVETLKEELIQLSNAIELDRHMLSTLVGEQAGSLGVQEPLMARSKTPLSLPSNLSSDLLARRPDLTAQIWKVEAAAELIGAAKADFYPRVNLMALAGLESLSFSRLFKAASTQANLAPSIHLPIFKGGALRANLQKHVALFNEETFRYNEMVLKAVQEVADEISTLKSSFELLKAQERVVRLTKEKLLLQRARQEGGLDPAFSALMQEEELLEQKSLYIYHRRNYLLGIVKLIKALGGGYGN